MAREVQNTRTANALKRLHRAWDREFRRAGLSRDAEGSAEGRDEASQGQDEGAAPPQAAANGEPRQLGDSPQQQRPGALSPTHPCNPEEEEGKEVSMEVSRWFSNPR